MWAIIESQSFAMSFLQSGRRNISRVFHHRKNLSKTTMNYRPIEPKKTTYYYFPLISMLVYESSLSINNINFRLQVVCLVIRYTNFLSCTIQVLSLKSPRSKNSYKKDIIKKIVKRDNASTHTNILAMRNL